jgi:hypothetical protein
MGFLIAAHPSLMASRMEEAMKAMRYLAGALCAVLATSPVGATLLYKSVSAEGVVQFSDTPPESQSTVIETRALPASVVPASLQAPAAQLVAMAQANDPAETDEALARAYARIDQAEHSLALARRALWSQAEGMSIEASRATRSDYERVEFYKRDVKAARQVLVEVLRARPMLLASR